MRRILFQETDFNSLPNPPAGFRYIGFDGPDFSEKGEDGQVVQAGGGTGPQGELGPQGQAGPQGPAGGGGGGLSDRLTSDTVSSILSNVDNISYLSISGANYFETNFFSIDPSNTIKSQVSGSDSTQASIQLYLDGLNNSFIDISTSDANGRTSDIKLSASNDFGEQSIKFEFYDGFSETKSFTFNKIGILEFPDGTTQSTAFNGQSGGSVLQEVTYSELSSLIETSGLSTGTYYKITDFRTCYDQPDFDYNMNPITGDNYKTSDIHPIIILATSENTISVDAYQPDYPNDKIKYDISFTQSEITGGTAYGRIVERIDENGNRTDYDHRNILFKRYRSYELVTEINGSISNFNSGLITGYGTSFNDELNIGDIVFLPTQYSNGRGFYKVTDIISATQAQVEGQNYWNYEYQNGDKGLPMWTCQYLSEFIDDEPEISSFMMDGEIKNGDSYFGTSSNYFTNHYPGLFAMVADSTSVDYFEITGNVGSDGGGTVDSYSYSTVVNGQNYKAFARRIFDAGDPSINHIIIVNTDGTGIEHTYDDTSSNDDDRIQGLSSNGVTQIHYLLTGLRGGIPITDQMIDDLVESYLTLVEGQTISQILENLNANYETVLSFLPARIEGQNGTLYYFNDSGFNYIYDGGNDMYDTSNFLNTDLFQHIPYTHTQMLINNYLDICQSNVIGDTDYAEYTTFELVDAKNNYIGDFSKYQEWFEEPFMLANNVFGKFSNQKQTYSNYFGDGTFNNSFAGDVRNNNFQGIIFGNVFYGDLYDNKIMNRFSSNRMLEYTSFYSNLISNNFNSNLILNDFYYNQIYSYFSNNVNFYNFTRNEIGSDYQNNRHYGEFSSNKIGNNVGSNYFFNVSICNTLKDDFNNNKIYYIFENNSIDKSCYDNTFYNNFTNNEIGVEFNNNTTGESSSLGYGGFSYNTIGDLVKSNLFLGNNSGNKYGHSFYSNQLSNYTSTNTFGELCLFNNLGENFNNNSIQNQFDNNEIGDNFQFNTIGGYFQNNIISDNFGFGGGNSRGNKIGNYFTDNEIGEYFYDNNIADVFNNNIVGPYFQLNDIKVQNLNNVDFNEFYGNITGKSDNIGASPSIPGTDGTYTGLTSSGGTGKNATFDVVVSGSVVTSCVINLSGNLYSVSDALTILGSKFGGTDGQDIIITVTTISDTPVVYTTTNANIVKDYNGDNKLYYVGPSGIVVIPITQTYD